MMICVTNRMLCKGDFFQRLEQIASQRPVRIILREKDLSEEEYGLLADQCQTICAAHQSSLIVHSYPKVAQRLGSCLQLPLGMLKDRGDSWKDKMEIGVSVHSVEEAKLAQRLGASYLIAGHIYPTSCKPGLKPRGLSFLEAVVQSVSLPVYAIGGILPEHLPKVKQTGAAGYCVMSPLMRSENPADLIRQYEKKWKEK